jgi:hypothetical protein
VFLTNHAIDSPQPKQVVVSSSIVVVGYIMVDRSGMCADTIATG